VTAYYESDLALAQYLWLHYGEEEEILQAFSPFIGALRFPIRCAAALAGAADAAGGAIGGRSSCRALDVGCAVGRSTFELARVCEEAVGIDVSASFIRAAQALQRGESIDYATPVEGDWVRVRTARMPAGVDPARVRFEVGDAERLRPDLGAFDYVLAANLICRLREPRRFLDRLPALVKPGGRLLIATPSTWRQIYTPRENWIGGYDGPDGPVRTLDSLQRILAPHFDLELRADFPLLIPEHARKYELIISEATRWRRR
jgi:putative 4-mercaptohistidine N1-methyltranferase